ncbi:hypothetical protein TanjilG_11167 [Lupinus angustifolius]|uniref:Uncharacterized protein n=1 Tax=Lupinus angustifolius TaxID=3871 RepID=A0A394DFL1_LUPAN|nr:hypothetical protein TanjilG_11167 [Lupinus angustifolius]
MQHRNELEYKVWSSPLSPPHDADQTRISTMGEMKCYQVAEIERGSYTALHAQISRVDLLSSPPFVSSSKNEGELWTHSDYRGVIVDLWV